MNIATNETPEGYSVDLSVWNSTSGKKGATWIAYDPELNRFEDDYGSEAEARLATRFHAVTGVQLSANDTASLVEQLELLQKQGWVVGLRDPRLNRNYAGRFMVVEPHEESELPTDDGTNGPWCVVGDDLSKLIGDAHEALASMVD